MIPSIRNARMMAKKKHYTIGCINCHKPLWIISEIEKYGTRVSANKESFPGVPAYSEYWAKDQKTALRTDCPFCHQDYLKAIKVGEKLFPKLYILEDHI